MKEKLYDAYSFIFEEELLNEIFEVGTNKFIPAGETILNVEEYVTSIPLLLDGAIKISRVDNDGDELLLYFLERGDTCAVTLTCCLERSKSEIKAVTEKETRLVMIPVEKMEEWIIKYKSWRTFIFQSYNLRLKEMLDAIDSVAFFRMDKRLLQYLQDKAKINQNETLQVTHQEIAYDLHTSRVVISRLLKTLEMDGKISLRRNSLVVLDL
ncbi:Crp/Fnr family transcriptional regulator [Christiangramia forsetii]|uniref:Crp family transcriptional regulator protein n=2 Tax=Christiangramia forsetii TaxID=411153 RepID=A0M0V1_CHRFK|nr:Crp/Fnr family transcriptional regulator [Christiangramia forsetii]GGG43455.1 global nitrogen regulator NtcA [Christiangramia forsetii]CAL66246.1 Crp family transcriptional regulator protein [Christiangramia forsetii KT0803]